MIRIEKLRRRDFNSARTFAIEGMHMGWYTSNSFELYLYSKSFWNMELSRATTALGAYSGDRLVGVLLADMFGRPRAFRSFWHKVFVKLLLLVAGRTYRGSFGTYYDVNVEMLRSYCEEHTPDGELLFFAVDPECMGKGIGTLLLDELERQEMGKLIYLFSDSGSTHQFYPRRGFDEVGRKDITLQIHEREVPLTCMMFSKRI